MKTKQITIRIRLDFYQQLVAYAETHYLPLSRVITQSVAKTIAYKPQKATPRPEQYGEPDVNFTDEELEDLQHRAASAPLRPAT